MSNYTSLLRQQLGSPTSQWNVYEHPSFTSACKDIATSPKNQSTLQTPSNLSKTVPLRAKKKVDLVSCYKSVLRLSCKPNKDLGCHQEFTPARKQPHSYQSYSNLQMIEERMTSEQDQGLDDYDDKVKHGLWHRIIERESTATTSRERQKVPNPNSVVVRPFANGSNSAKIGTSSRKILIDVKELIQNSKSSKSRDRKENRYRSR